MNLTNSILTVALIIVSFLLFQQCNETKQLNNHVAKVEVEALKHLTNWQDLSDTVDMYKNENGILTNSAEILEISNEEALRENENLKAAVGNLEGKITSLTQVINKNKFEGSTDNVEINFRDTSEVTMIKFDPENRDREACCDVLDSLANPRFFYGLLQEHKELLPSYTGRDSTKWLDVTATLGPDSMDYEIYTTDEIVLSSSKLYKWWKFWRPAEHIMFGQSLSPHTEKLIVKPYVIREKQRWVEPGILVGYGLDKNFTPTPIIGVGVVIKPWAIFKGK